MNVFSVIVRVGFRASFVWVYPQYCFIKKKVFFCCNGEKNVIFYNCLINLLFYIMKKKTKASLKKFEDVLWFVTIVVSIASSLPVGSSAGSIEELCNAFIRQGYLAWFGAMALIWLMAEIFCHHSEASWKFYRSYWIVTMALLYGFLALFATEWNWSAVILPVVFVLRWFMPYEWVEVLQKVFPEEEC